MVVCDFILERPNVILHRYQPNIKLYILSNKMKQSKISNEDILPRGHILRHSCFPFLTRRPPPPHRVTFNFTSVFLGKYLKACLIIDEEFIWMILPQLLQNIWNMTHGEVITGKGLHMNVVSQPPCSPPTAHWPLWEMAKIFGPPPLATSPPLLNTKWILPLTGTQNLWPRACLWICERGTIKMFRGKHRLAGCDPER